MEDRYEIKGKIGQGGLGAVYRAHDVRMNREVAIKRIIANSDDATLPEEATRQLIKEAGSLASLQHPNIVTIYDVGTDDDGPFVVMELLTGETLEEIIGKGSFTWQDFRQLAPQILEALIAAQELNLVHRDLKPSNIMLTWLPSGKFQVKIVDFGLAKLSAKPSLQTIDQSDGVFGSIYFMAPEQFERVPIDLKADLYAIGCVFYYALTGSYPFDGDTAAEVMASHLQHHTTPLQEVRDGIPLWACDWIMWHVNRQPSDRPESARAALQNFLENDAHTDSPVSTGTPAPAVEQLKRPKLLVPGGAPVPQVVQDPSPTQPVKTAAAPKALAPPEGSKPSVHTTAQVVHVSRNTAAATPTVVSVNPVPESEKSGGAQTPTIAPALTPKSIPVPVSAIAKAAPARPIPVSPIQPVGPITQHLKPAAVTPTAAEPDQEKSKSAIPPISSQKKGMPNGMKAVIAVILGLLAVVLGVALLKKSGSNAETRIYNEMISLAAKPETKELPIDEKRLEILLRNATSVGSVMDRQNVYNALYLAKATDGTDIDGAIAEAVTTRDMVPDVRNTLIREVLRKRGDPKIIGTLLDYARSTKDPKAAVASLEAVRFMVTDEHLQTFVEIIQNTKDDNIRKAAEGNAAKILEKSTSTAALGNIIAAAHDSAPNDVIRHSMLRLLAGIGGEEALKLAKKNLASEDDKDKIAAIVSLGKWKDQPGLQTLVEYIASGPNLQLRSRAFDSAVYFATESAENKQDNWTLIAAQAKIQEEFIKLIRGVATSKPEPWAFSILENIVATADDDKAIDLAERAIQHLKDVQKTQAPKKDN
jgi:serine/threonine protein kinase